ncbi:hypothetical protein Syun_001445 [Stephania yunnanensis]|uniref:Uncharacterized protein n=1 Tax=Stephania yunnanensis TaxID=152371 RepID=A0AAP0LGP0_9MAGN
MQDHKSTSISHQTNNTNKQRPQIQGKYRSVQDIRLERVFHYEALDGCCPCDDDDRKCVYCVHPAYTYYIAALLGFLSIPSLAAYVVAISDCLSNPSRCANGLIEDDLF